MAEEHPSITVLPSQQAAAEVLPHFPDGAWLCELAAVTDPGAVWEALAATLGITPAPGRPLADFIKSLGPAYAVHRIDALVAGGYACDIGAVRTRIPLLRVVRSNAGIATS